MILYDLPEPPSANRYWRHAKGRTYLSAEAKAYRLAVADAYPHSTIAYPTEALSIRFAWYRGKKSGDLDNRIKQLLDALCWLAYTDDKQIVHIECTRHDDNERKGRVDIQIVSAVRLLPAVLGAAASLDATTEEYSWIQHK